MKEQQPIIRLENIRKAFNSQAVLTGVDLDIAPGVTTVVIGPSGCGKTVLLKHIIGLLKPDTGNVVIDGEEITGMKEDQLITNGPSHYPFTEILINLF